MDNTIGACRYNKGVECVLHTRCAACGWNPQVSNERVNELRRKRGTSSSRKMIEVFKYPAWNL